MDHPSLSSRVVTVAQCAHLRHKGMYVGAVPDPADARFYDPVDSTAYWCLCTQKATGPDGQPASPESCRQGRACCEQ